MKNEKLQGGLCPEPQTTHNFPKSLRMLESNLTDAQVLEIYHSGKTLFVLDEQTDEVNLLCEQAVEVISRCQKYLAFGKDIACVRTYLTLLFNGKEGQEAIGRMRNKQTQPQFLCEQVGRMIELGIFYARTVDIANCLRYKRLQMDSVQRYIRKGKNIQKKIGQSV